MRPSYDACWYKSILDAMEDLVLVKDSESKLLWANEAFLNLSGLDDDTIYKKIDTEQSSPSDTAQYLKDDRIVVKTCKSLNIRAEGVSGADGEVKFFNTIKSPILSSDQKVEKIVGVSRILLDEEDTAELKVERDKRNEFIAFQKNFLKQLRIPSVFLDVQSRIISVSQVFSEFFNLDDGFFINRSIYDVFSDQKLNPLNVSDGKMEYKEFEISLNSVTVVGDLTIAPWFIEGDIVGGYLALFQDRTDEMKLAELLKQEKKRSVLSDRIRSLGEFSAGIGHEINNPLSIITGTIEKIKTLQQDSLNDPALKKGLEVIERNSQRIETIVNSLRALSRDSSNDEASLYRIEPILKDALTLVRGRAINSGIEIKLDVQDNFVFKCHPGELVQVLVNLVNNSIDAVKKSDNAWIKMRSFSKDGSNFLSVVDSGNGISIEHVNSIFDPFFTTKGFGEGTGLGLGICADIVHRHGADIYLDDKKEHTTFSIRIPRHEC